MPALSHLTPCTSTKSNSLANAASDPDLTFHVPKLMSLLQCSGRTKGSVQVRGTCSCYVTKPVFKVKSRQHLAQTRSWRTTPYWLCATDDLIYLQLPSILEVFPPSLPEDALCRGGGDSSIVTWGRALPWWQWLLHRYLRTRLAEVAVTRLSRTDVCCLN